MVCARFRGALSALAAGGPTSAPLLTHLAACAACRTELEAMRQALAIADRELAQLSLVEPSSSFVPRLLAATMASRRAPWRATWLWPSLATALALVLTVILSVSDRGAPQLVTVMDAQPASAPSRAPVQESPPDAAVAHTVERVATAPARHERAAPSRRSEPQVLVPTEESRALIEWVALLNRERRSSAALIAAAESSGRVTAPNSIEIQPIEIVPLDSASNAGT